ncbi:MAG: HD domain-containing phosphohydrolase [Vampirovibrionales bacterium]|nr:HD domain-containing phosphohydrolase [Vampirovibrionales bacterium]
MLVKVTFDELNTWTPSAQTQTLPFSLLSPAGELVLPAGEAITGLMLKQLRQTPLYRNPSELPVNHEGVWLSGSEGGLTPEETFTLAAEDAMPSVWDVAPGADLDVRFMAPMAEFFNQLSQGILPDVALLSIARDKLVSEVTSRVDEVQILSQLRVRDGYTYDHTLDVTAISIALAKHIGLDDETIRDVGLAAILHDLGKMLIPKPIMFKESRLTVQEFEVMKLHPRLGYNMIRDVLRLPDHIARPALEHQEMHGGGGYPLDLKGDEIHPFSQIVKIADVYDALTSKRPYKQPIPSNKAIKIMLSEGEKSFNPVLLQQFTEMANYSEAA